MLLRVGEKIIDRDKIYKAVDDILEMRSRGLSQQEIANRIGLDRTAISRLETLGEVRKGGRIALVGFPIKNCEEIAVWPERRAWIIVCFSRRKSAGILFRAKPA